MLRKILARIKEIDKILNASMRPEQQCSGKCDAVATAVLTHAELQ